MILRSEPGMGRHAQSGYIAILFAALLALGLSLTVGTLVAQLKRNGALDRSMVAANGNIQQAELVADEQLLLAWYRNNAYAVDSLSGQPAMSQILSQAGVQLAGASYDVSTLILDNGVGYHVFALWFPLPGAAGTGLNKTTGQFQVGTLNGQPANTPYVLVSGLPLESQLVQQTRTNMYRIADLLVAYFDTQNAADADMDASVNWFRDSACSTTAVALPCYGSDNNNPSATAVPVSQTALQPMIGLSDGEMVTAWAPNTVITVNNYTTATLPPFVVVLNSMLPWGGYLTVDAVSD